MRSAYVLGLLLLHVVATDGQPSDSLIIAQFQEQVHYLASDRLAGRLPGSRGEKKAAHFIRASFRQAGLVPAYRSFYQKFSYTVGKKPTGRNRMLLNGHTLVLHSDYFPLNVSANGRVRGHLVDVGYGIVAPALNYDSYRGLSELKGKIFLIECSSPEGDNPHSSFAPYTDILKRVQAARERGAIGVVFTNTSPDAADLKPNWHIRTSEADIPVVFIKGAIWKQRQHPRINIVDLQVELTPIQVHARNVVGMLNNNASTVAVIGAHYDHLGRNEFGGSMIPGETAVHNGADDNASGTVVMMHLAHMLASNNLHENNNYLFVAFSAEEQGLVGSKYFVRHPPVDAQKFNFMINMDMVGRYRHEKGLEISGLGTSPDAFGFIRTMQYDTLIIKPKEAGTGPTDHTSFYHAGIPVLSFFTGIHEDYHKPSDDADRLNYNGMLSIARLMYRIILEIDQAGKLPFTQTTEQEMSPAPSFTVRLGVIPDYSYEGPGLRLEGIIKGQVAEQAGLQAGDILLSIGDFSITDIMSYMKALAAFKKGDTVTIRFLRSNEPREVQLTF